MRDEKKFKILSVLTTLLILCIISYNVFQEYFKTEIGDYIKRRIYYEKVISKKELSLHKGKYWRKVE
jgi:hypothetical protein